ncbi:glycosyltransferase [Desulfobulbus propionicus]
MITILITVGVLAPERREPVLAALRQNLVNPLVRDIQVVTEAPSAEVMAWLKEAAGTESHRLHLTHIPSRPNFADMLRIGNALLADGADTVAMMNADISIASEEDAKRILETLSFLNARNTPTVLSLTRHEANNGQIWLGLYDLNGLPNTISADAWIFQKQIHTDRDLFYMPGQMNCDMMLTYDLLNTGYKLFNPCLDITIIHHEPAKDEIFYKEKNLEVETQKRLEKHAAINNVNPWNYYGIPWVHSSWLKMGYRPFANSTNGRRLILALPHGTEHRLAEFIPRLVHLTNAYEWEIQILFEGDLNQLVSDHAAAVADHPRIYFTKPERSIETTRRSFLQGNENNFWRLAFISNIARVDETLLANSAGIFVTVGLEEFSPPPATGCTLITSLFRSDYFLKGFARNITSLSGYNHLIEHIILVSNLSGIEIDGISSLLKNHSNILVIKQPIDPGLYEFWNIGIRIARTEYVSNANVDDLRHPKHVVTLLRRLEARPHVVVAATALVPVYEYPEVGSLPEVRETWYSDQAGQFKFQDLARLEDPATLKLIPNNLPHCMPIWRRSVHDHFGWFDEARFGTYADWAFWLKVLEDGNTGWLDPEPLSFYYVNPTSHNRRGSRLKDFHRSVEATFTPRFAARLTGQPPEPHPLPNETPRKLHLLGLDHFYGQHRNSFNALITALEPLNKGQGGVRFVPFLERQFVWGNCAADGEAASCNPRPITEPWIGILHVPFDTPDWFEHSVTPRHFFKTALFQESLPFCRGLITLSDDLQNDLAKHLPGLSSLSLKFPTAFDVRMWEPKDYFTKPCVVQAGDWLRKIQAIFRIKAPTHRKIMLLKKHTFLFMQREISIFGDSRNSSVEMLEYVSNEKYDDLLTQSVVLCLMYSTAANNILIECIARATPILVNPLPGAVEYLGEDYPLYVLDETEASAVLAKPSLIELTHTYLLRRRAEIDLSYQGFCNALGTSMFYKNL